MVNSSRAIPIIEESTARVFPLGGVTSLISYRKFNLLPKVDILFLRQCHKTTSKPATKITFAMVTTEYTVSRSVKDYDK